MRLTHPCAIFALLAAPLLAQEFRGTISGAVADPTGGRVANAKISATETRTGATAEAKSDSSGTYSIPFLAPGTYKLTAEVAGFKKYVREDIQLGPGDHPVIDIPLEVGDVSQSVSVVAEIPLLNTENASMGQTITTKQVEDFPLNGRTPMMLAQLSIGVIATGQPSLVHPFDNAGRGGVEHRRHTCANQRTADGRRAGRDLGRPPGVQSAAGCRAGSAREGVRQRCGLRPHRRRHGEPDYEDRHQQLSRLACGSSRRPRRSTRSTSSPTRAARPSGDALQSIWTDGRRPGDHSEGIQRASNKLFWFFAWENLDDAQPNNSTLRLPRRISRPCPPTPNARAISPRSTIRSTIPLARC